MRRSLITFLFSCGILSILLGLIFLVSRHLIINSFAALERESCLRNIERVANALSSELEYIRTINADYSGWDQAYTYVQDRNPEFEQVNLAEGIFGQLRLNLLAIIDGQGEMIYGKAYDLRNDRVMALPSGIDAFLSPGGPLAFHATPESFVSGIISLPAGLMLVTSLPILKSNYKGPVAGALVMGRFLDEAQMESLAEKTRLRLELGRAQHLGLPAEFALALSSPGNRGSGYLHAENSQTISGFHILADISNRPVGLIKVSMTREIYDAGNQVLRYFLLWFLLIGLLAALLIAVFLQRLRLTHRRAEQSEERYYSVVRHAVEGIALVEPETFRIMEANPSLHQLLEVKEGELQGRSLLDFLGGPEGREQNLACNPEERREITFRSTSGGEVILEVSGRYITGPEGKFVSFVLYDVTERKRLENELLRQANYDPLTGLPNRVLLADRFRQAVASVRRRGGLVAFVLLDIDRFKQVNDTLGHAQGDQLLREVGKILSRGIRESDTLARIGGDEFVVLLSEMRHIRDIVSALRNMRQQLVNPIYLGAQEVFVSVSMGVALYPFDGDELETVFRKADMALYHVKAHGRDGYHFFSEKMTQAEEDRLLVEGHLRQALKRQELFLHYQPRVFLANGELSGVEALIRWRNPELGLVPPGRFIPVAEDTGFIVPMGEWVLHEACRQLRIWQEQGHRTVRVSVNLSARQFLQRDFVDVLYRVMRNYGVDAERFEFEVTESLMMKNVDESVAQMAAIKRLGSTLAIDDFGTGFSSLSSLQHFPLDRVKIDKSFVNRIGVDSSALSIIRAIVSMARSLGLAVVAEGVETEAQLSFLRGLRVEEVQGYLFSQPLSPEVMSDLLGKRILDTG